jgi:hypothetical protein
MWDTAQNSNRSHQGAPTTPGHNYLSESASFRLHCLFCFCCHPERSEGPRGYQPSPTLRIFLPPHLLAGVLHLDFEMWDTPQSSNRSHQGAPTTPGHNDLSESATAWVPEKVFSQNSAHFPHISHVKPPIIENPRQSSTIAWHSSSTPSAILDTELKKAPDKTGPSIFNAL